MAAPVRVDLDDGHLLFTHLLCVDGGGYVALDDRERPAQLFDGPAV